MTPDPTASPDPAVIPVTPADVLTPHPEPAEQTSGEPAADPASGLADPRHLPGPDILAAPPPGLPPPD